MYVILQDYRMIVGGFLEIGKTLAACYFFGKYLTPEMRLKSES